MNDNLSPRKNVVRTANRRLVIRLTDGELALWLAYADLKTEPPLKARTIASVIRDGMNAVCSKQCLCRPSRLACPHCKANAPADEDDRPF